MPAKLIYVVDDQDLVLRTLVRCVKRLRPEDSVASFSAPQELLKSAFDGRWPDLVITDLDMPDINGEQLASSLKYAGFAGAVVMITGNGDIAVPPPHVDDLLHKPYEMKDLGEILDRHLDRP